MIKKIQLQVSTGCTTSDQLLSWFEQLNQPPLPDLKIWWQCQTMLQEGVANVVDHAHKNLPPETPIDIEAIRFDHSLEIHIWDYGLSFNLEQKLKDISNFEDNESDRGRGLKIMSEIADSLSYERTEDQRNCLVIVKHY